MECRKIENIASESYKKKTGINCHRFDSIDGLNYHCVECGGSAVMVFEKGILEGVFVYYKKMVAL